MHSQNQEEAIILDYFREYPIATNCAGFFLDIGAYDGKTFSNTLALAESGTWCGVCVEPSPSSFPHLKELHKDRPAINVIEAAVVAGPSQGRIKFHDAQGDAVSTLRQEHRKRWEDGSSVKFLECEVETIGLEGLLAQFNWRFDMISLDVEGMNWELFRALPFQWLHELRLIVVEHDGHQDSMETLAIRYGFEKIHENAENLIFVR